MGKKLFEVLKIYLFASHYVSAKHELCACLILSADVVDVMRVRKN